IRSSSSSTRSTKVSARLPESWRISSRWRGVNFSWYVSRLVCLLFVLFFMSHPASEDSDGLNLTHPPTRCNSRCERSVTGGSRSVNARLPARPRPSGAGGCSSVRLPDRQAACQLLVRQLAPSRDQRHH